MVWREIKPRYDDPETYGVDESYFDKGKYPPDWGRRCKAIWQRQSKKCGRCGRSRNQVHNADVHHIRSLSDGGLNKLDNLAGLCGDCHALIHPHNQVIEGYYREAPVFPATDAVPKVATVRSKEVNNIALSIKHDLETLERFSSPDVNQLAVNAYTYNIESEYARELPEQLTSILQEHSVIAESSDYSLIEITVKLQGIRGIISTYTPEINISSNGTLVEWIDTDWIGRWRTISQRVRLSDDANEATLRLSDGNGTTKKTVSIGSERSSVSFTARPPTLLA